MQLLGTGSREVMEAVELLRAENRVAKEHRFDGEGRWYAAGARTPRIAPDEYNRMVESAAGLGSTLNGIV